MPNSKKRSRMDSKKSKHKKKKKSYKSIFKKILLTFVFLGAVAGIAISIYLYTILGVLDEFDPDALDDYQLTTFVYDKEDTIISSIHGAENRIEVPLSSIPIHVQEAFIAAEDIRFRSHPGFDIKRIFGSLYQNIKARAIVAGGGTITQQVIRNTILTQEQTIDRKVKEVFLAWQLEKRYSKDQILEMYLNTIYFAEGAYGIEAAAKTYFNKTVSELSVAEGALLTGIIKNPHRNSPFKDLNRSLERKDLIIDLMVKNGKLSEQEGQKAKEEELVFAEKTKPDYVHGYFMDMVIKEAASILGVGQEELYTSGYRIYTSLESPLQDYVEDLYKKEELFPKSPASGKTSESALVILDTSTGEVRAIAGGRTYPEGQRGVLNRALEPQPPGSVIKPLLVYTPAIELNLYTPADFIVDEKININNYSPNNSSKTFEGPMTIRSALARSINIPAVKIFQEVGVSQGKAFAQNMGISFKEEDNHLALALGAMEIGTSPIELARAFASLGDRGAYKDYTTIRRILDSQGRILYEAKPNKRQVITEDTAFLINSMLQSATQAGPSGKRGTAYRLDGLKLAAKTGTVELPDTAEYKNIRGINHSWVVAYNPEYTLSVWMGFDRRTTEDYLPSDAYGGAHPTIIARNVFDFIYDGKTPPDFVKPLGVVEVNLDKRALEEEKKVLLASPLTPKDYIVKEYFKRDTVPTEQSEYWVVPSTPYNFNVSLNDQNFPLVSFTPADEFAIYAIMRAEEGHEAIAVHRIDSGNLDPVNWIDYQVEKGKTYQYFIVPIHKEMKQDGKPVEGNPTNPISVQIPRPGFGDFWDWLFPGRGNDEEDDDNLNNNNWGQDNWGQDNWSQDN
jgi:1A family penicillin-binding protein